MKNKKSKLLLIGTTILSLFAVFVAGISTFAWFQVNTAEAPQLSDSGFITSDSTDLNISDVTSYKYRYSNPSFGVINYSDGAAVKYGSNDNVNSDKEDRKNADVPTEGEGYYILGNTSWVVDWKYKTTGTTITTSSDEAKNNQWKYSSALRLEDDTIDGSSNIAIYNGIYLTEGTVFRVRRHELHTTSGGSEISYQVRPTDNYINSVLGDYVASGENRNNNDLFSVDSESNFVVGSGGSGYYNIFLFEVSSTKKMSFVRLNTNTSPKSRTLLKTKPIKRSLSSTSTSMTTTIWWYWGNRSMTPYICYKDSEGTWHHLNAMTSGSDSNSAYYDVPSGVSQVIFVNSNGSDWWNQTADLDIKTDSTNGLCNKFTSDNYDISGSWGHYTGLKNTIIYNNNGGSGSISDQDIWLNNATLNNGSAFTRVGYDLSGWNTESNGSGTPYSLGASITYSSFPQYENNSSLTLYAQWTKKYPFITYGVDDGVSSWTNTEMSLLSGTTFYYDVSLTTAKAFKVTRDGTYYGYNSLDNNGKTLFNASSNGGSDKNVKPIVKGAYRVTFDISTNKISFTTTSTSFNSLTGDDEMTYYLSSEVSSWNVSANYAIIAYDGDGNTGWFPMSGLGYDDLYSATITGTYTGLYFIRYGNSAGTYTVWNRTVAISKGGSNDNWYIINTDDSGTPAIYSNSSSAWETFYGDVGETGYYLVGDSNFEYGTGITPWTFNLANKLDTDNPPLQCRGIFRNRHLSTGMEFRIWHYISGSGRQGDGWKAINSDAQTTAVLDASGDNVTVRSGVDGYFDIYVLSNNKIMVKDHNEGTKLYYKYGITEGSYNLTKATSTSGDNFIAVYEQGLHVTSGMASSGVYIGMVRQYAGAKTSCGTSATSYDFLGDSASIGFTGDGVADFSCLKITKPGLYNFYWRSSDNKIYITSRPYLETNGTKTMDGDDGYYIVTYGSSTISSVTAGSSTFTNGLKMKTDQGESANESNNNIAEYERFTVAANTKVFFKAFFNNRELKDTMPIYRADDTATQSLITTDGAGVFTFTRAGTYNIYLFKDYINSHGGRRTISVASDSLSDFSKLNSIPSNATANQNAVKNNNTTMIVEVTFTTTKSMDLSLNSVITPDVANGLASKVIYNCFLDSTIPDNNSNGVKDPDEVYDYFRSDGVGAANYRYSALKAMTSNTTLDLGTVAAGTHHAYIVIDYNYAQVSSISGALVNDFYFLLKATQTS